MAASLSLSTSNITLSSGKDRQNYLSSRPNIQFKTSNVAASFNTSQHLQHQQLGRLIHRFRVSAKTEGSTKSSQSDERIPSWARPDSDEPPPWASEEQKNASEQAFEIPFYAYLLASAITAIAAIGSIFEYVNQRPVFGVLNSDSVFYAPLLGFFAFTGIPTSAFLWFKSVQAANKAAKEQDRRDGFL